MSNWYIIYSCGNKKKLSVVEICESLQYELNDYSVASRKSFTDEESAIKYAKSLAVEHGLDYDGPCDGHDYLD